MTEIQIEPKMRRAFHGPLAAWFQKHKRDLPWRTDRTPYRVTVSEFMLQQTQVSTVLPYYARWMKQFPSWSTLARANETEVIKAWEGLGYYTRARNLHRLAQAVVERGGELPADVASLRSLPGIGPYTAGAISSLAFEQKAALVDGNVIRVLARVFHITEDVSQPRVQKAFWALAEGLLPEKHCGAHNESLMELGAMLCTPHNPQCLLCPLQPVCQSPDPDALPVKKRTAIVESEETLAILHQGESLWCEPPAGGRQRLGSFWKLPLFDPSQMSQGDEITRFTYGITKYRVRLTAVNATWKKKPSATGQWVTPEEITRHAFPAAHRKVLKFL
jgi:A/G-specific adenine glycosylase